MIEIMCKSRGGSIYHAQHLGIGLDVPEFKTVRQARTWCERNDWKCKGKDGITYELCIHGIY